jgi:hypothetical protein
LIIDYILEISNADHFLTESLDEFQYNSIGYKEQVNTLLALMKEAKDCDATG